MRMCIVIIIAAGLLTIEPRPSHSFCFDAAAARYKIAPQILKSIAYCESDMNAAAINYNTDGSYDFGVMQINTINEPLLRKSGIKWNSLADPCTNVMVGAWLLSQHIREYGYNWKAIGAYHSKTPAKRDAYARKIAKAITEYHISDTEKMQSPEKSISMTAKNGGVNENANAQ